MPQEQESLRGADGPAGSDQGTALLGTLQAVATDVSTMFVALTNTRPGTSQDRRRMAHEAGECADRLTAVCHDFETWIVGRQPRANAENTPDQSGALFNTLSHVSSAQAALDQARAHLQDSVEAVRADGASWRSVGEALGITGQTAHKRFDPKARERHAASMRERTQRLAGRVD